jgi:C-terminal processing protease CtpA/Prc
VITGDSLEYEFLDNAVKQLKDPIGVSVELGIRRGQGSKTIIDAYRKYHLILF